MLGKGPAHQLMRGFDSAVSHRVTMTITRSKSDTGGKRKKDVDEDVQRFASVTMGVNW